MLKELSCFFFLPRRKQQVRGTFYFYWPLVSTKSCCSEACSCVCWTLFDTSGLEEKHSVRQLNLNPPPSDIACETNTGWQTEGGGHRDRQKQPRSGENRSDWIPLYLIPGDSISQPASDGRTDGREDVLLMSGEMKFTVISRQPCQERGESETG